MATSPLYVSGGGFKFSQCTKFGTWEWEVVSQNDKCGPQNFFVSNINTPYGLFTSVSVPIPAEVINAMYQSVFDMISQLSPKIMLVGQSSFSLTVTEGDPDTFVGNTVLTNAGAYGSVMSVSATQSAQWLKSRPTSMDGVGKNQQVSFESIVKPTLMSFSNSPYSGTISYQDNTGNTVVASFAIAVLPRPMINASSTSIVIGFYICTVSNTGPISLTITNSGPVGSSLSFNVSKVQNQSNWLLISPTSAGPIPSGGSVNISLSLDPDKAPRIPGVYTDIIRISSNNASNSPIDIPFTLNVFP